MTSRTIKLPHDVDRITIEEAITLILDAGTFMAAATASIDDGSKEGVDTDLLGYEAVVIDAEGGFLDAAQELGITPRHCNYPFKPYIGVQNTEFSITVDEFRRYASAYGLTIELETCEEQAAMKLVPLRNDGEAEPWIAFAHEHARDIWLAMLDRNDKPTKSSIAQELAGRLNRAGKVMKSGRPFNALYVERWALRDWTPPRIRQ